MNPNGIVRVLVSILSLLLLHLYGGNQDALANPNRFDGDLVVTATGAGVSEKDALDNALLHAVQMAVGTLIVSERSIENDALTEQLASYANGFVRSYRVIARNTDRNGLHEIEITALVSSEQVFATFDRGTSVRVPADSSAIYAQMVTERIRLLEGDKLLDHVINQFPKSAFYVEVISPLHLVEPLRDGDAIVGIKVRVNLNLDYYKNLSKAFYLTSLSRDSDKGSEIYGAGEMGHGSRTDKYGKRYEEFFAPKKQLLQHWSSRNSIYDRESFYFDFDRALRMRSRFFLKYLYLVVTTRTLSGSALRKECIEIQDYLPTRFVWSMIDWQILPELNREMTYTARFSGELVPQIADIDLRISKECL